MQSLLHTASGGSQFVHELVNISHDTRCVFIGKKSMILRMTILTMLIVASVYGGGFIEPDPAFLQGFWKVLPTEVERDEKSIVAQVEPLSLFQEKMVFECPKPSSAVWWFRVAAGIALLGAVAEGIALLKQVVFEFRLNRALKHRECLLAQKLLQQRLAMPPGSTLTELAAKIEDRFLVERILACEKAHYMLKTEGGGRV